MSYAAAAFRLANALANVFTAPSSAAGAAGLLYGGGSDGAALLGKQTVAVLAVGTFSFVMAFIIGKVIDSTMGFRISEDDEVTGIDQVEHAETGYELHQGFGGMRTAPVGAVVEDGEKERVDA